jgi:predicted nuclease of predicted toxin-antitoxin system
MTSILALFSDAGLIRAEDIAMWSYARDKDIAIVTKDRDLEAVSARQRYGTPAPPTSPRHPDPGH